MIKENTKLVFYDAYVTILDYYPENHLFEIGILDNDRMDDENVHPDHYAYSEIHKYPSFFIGTVASHSWGAKWGDGLRTANDLIGTHIETSQLEAYFIGCYNKDFPDAIHYEYSPEWGNNFNFFVQINSLICIVSRSYFIFSA